MLLRILREWEPLQEFIGPDPGAHVFDMSVGYDLAGISGPKVGGFIRSMRNASAEIDALRSQITGSWARFADLDFDTHMADTLTLSTFHGCPPDEIEGITKHLIDEHDLDVIVKLNPTLLGYDTVARIVNDELGYTDVSVKEQAFADDLQFDRGVELISQLNDYAKERGKRFGIKLTNTLVVNNTKEWMPEDTMYLSGPPLHVVAMSLFARLQPHLPADVMVSFSAGITKDNLVDSLATGINPATICSDLLKPGGYGRLAPMLRDLTKTIVESGCSSLREWRETHSVSAADYSARDPQRRHLCTQCQREAAPRGRPHARDVRLCGLQFLHHRVSQRCVLQHHQSPGSHRRSSAVSGPGRAVQRMWELHDVLPRGR